MSETSGITSFRLWLFAALCVACVALTAGYTWRTAAAAPAVRDVVLQPFTTPPAAERPVGAPGEFEAAPAAPPAALAAPGAPPATAVRKEPLDPRPVNAPPRFLVRHTALDKSYGVLAADPHTGSLDARRATTLRCERVHFAGNRGVCLDAHRGAVTTYRAVLFDASFTPTATLPLSGIPSRTRVSPDGRYAAITVFVVGHSYGGGDFSTETRIIDSVSGEPVLANLEQMEVWSNGSRLESSDFNFWGVTFTDAPNRFYATLGTGGVPYLVEGDIAANRVSVIRAGVECPSVSPDNTRVAFKKRVPSTGLPKWRIHVLDLATLAEVALAETRNVDEQVEWLDNSRILYTLADDGPSPAVTNVWVVPADGSGAPGILLPQAASATLLYRDSPPVQ